MAAGEDWDGVVAGTIAEGLAGLECLSGIPGLAGATPIQNVGAYGQEVCETITQVRAYDRDARRVRTLGRAECGFGYRTSRFKRDEARRLVVLSVTFQLASRAAVRAGPLRRAGRGPGGRSSVTGCPRNRRARPSSNCGGARGW